MYRESWVYSAPRHDLKMHNTAAKWVPHYFYEMQHWTYYDTSWLSGMISLQRGQHVKLYIAISETWARTYKMVFK